MIQFYAPDIKEKLRLPEGDSRHAIKVLRMQQGDELQAVDGHGNLYRCRIIDPNPKGTGVEIIGCKHQELPWPQEITLVVAPTKHMDRMEWLVEKVTEIGVNRIIPVIGARNERREIKVERLEKIAVSAMKQSLKTTLPHVCDSVPIKKVSEMVGGSNKYVGYCDKDTSRVDFSKAYTPLHNTAILIGPEGDFTPQEIDLLKAEGWLPVTFGPTRLRTETAALYGVTACHVLDQLQ